ncbi:TetR/AcrR family transcriptional regulator [Clostridium sp. 'White wine YQ']|uniref:TetR/AcrR family transcriptional regulator n=1 Tax=Clostridium sp. 'White wine YQ' TaxID=3027474 RepID=UPI002366E49C|nr:TetR/AcrR family transcriptional regulator [Clostridium sp. 'White wine YQ']MDD7793624.1 TetR/AcrR family transcriptional regulator [Clostridium sp. 'White wine YQ']
MERKIRKPTQKRALEKMDKILNASFKLFNEIGYYNTTTADIAKEAGVATGSVYAYFEDKKDIYLHVQKMVSARFEYPTKDFWIENKIIDLKDVKAVKDLFRVFIKLMIKYHDFSKIYHDELDALTLLDEDIKNLKQEQEVERKKKIYEIFEILDIPFKSEEDSAIFLHYCNLIIDDICHKILYDKGVKELDAYIDKGVDIIYSLFKSTTHIS